MEQVGKIDIPSTVEGWHKLLNQEAASFLFGAFDESDDINGTTLNVLSPDAFTTHAKGEQRLVAPCNFASNNLSQIITPDIRRQYYRVDDEKEDVLVITPFYSSGWGGNAHTLHMQEEISQVTSYPLSTAFMVRLYYHGMPSQRYYGSKNRGEELRLFTLFVPEELINELQKQIETRPLLIKEIMEAMYQGSTSTPLMKTRPRLCMLSNHQKEPVSKKNIVSEKRLVYE